MGKNTNGNAPYWATEVAYKNGYKKGYADAKAEGHTRADRIRSMTDDEFADHLQQIFECAYCPVENCEGVGPRCRSKILKWLKQPAEEVQP